MKLEKSMKRKAEYASIKHLYFILLGSEEGEGKRITPKQTRIVIHVFMHVEVATEKEFPVYCCINDGVEMKWDLKNEDLIFRN